MKISTYQTKRNTFWLIATLLILQACSSSLKMIQPDKFNYDGEEIQLLGNGLRIQYLKSNQFGISNKGKKYSLIALKIMNENDSAISIRQSQLKIQNATGRDIQIMNPPVKLAKKTDNGKPMIYFVIKEYDVVCRQSEMEAKYPILLDPTQRNLEGALFLGATNLALSKKNWHQQRVLFQSMIFFKPLPPHSSTFGWLLIKALDESHLKFSYQ